MNPDDPQGGGVPLKKSGSLVEEVRTLGRLLPPVRLHRMTALRIRSSRKYPQDLLELCAQPAQLRSRPRLGQPELPALSRLARLRLEVLARTGDGVALFVEQMTDP